MSAVQQLTTTNQIDSVVTASANGPVMIFKHSLTCGRSAMAEEEVAEFVESGQNTIPVYIVRIQGHRSVSAAIEARFRVRHESPQVLIVSHGRVIWSASHAGVSKAALEKKCLELRALRTAGRGI